MKYSKIRKVAVSLLAACFALCLLVAFLPVSNNKVKAEVSESLVMEKGASLFLNSESGLSFSYEISNYDVNKNYGMLIVPFDYLEKAGISLTDTVEDDYVSALNEAYKNGLIEYTPTVKENINPVLSDGKYVVKYAIKNLFETNYARKFFGIGFEKEETYKYAVQNDNVRSVFEVANLAANKLNFSEWDTTDDSAMSEKDVLADNESILNNFITKAFEFVYGTGKEITVSYNAVCIGGEVCAEIDNEKSNGKENVELDIHWNYDADENVFKQGENESLKGVNRGKSQVTAQIGTAISATNSAAVLKTETELEIYNNSNADFFGETQSEGSAFGSVALDGGWYNSSSNFSKDSGYLGFKNPDSADGLYTLNENGIYVEFYFNGNNMPNVEFFASNITGSIWKDDINTGFVVTNGCGNASLYQNYDDYKSGKDKNTQYIYSGIVAYEDYFNYYVSYNGKYGGGHGGNATALSTDEKAAIQQYNTRTKQWIDVEKSCSNFSMWSLMQNETQKWHYVIGLYKNAEGKVFADAKLYKVDATVEKLFAIKNEQIKIEAAQDILSDGQEIKGYIVAHAAIKGSGENSKTVFSYTLPYAGVSDRMLFGNAVFNDDGSVTLKSGYISDVTTPVDEIKNTKLGYVALEGSYKVGTLVDFYFKGSNMPIVSLFNKYVSDNLSNDYNGEAVNKGIIILNGVTKNGGSSVGNKKYQFEVYAPDRFYSSFNGMSRAYYLSDSKYKASNPFELSMAKLDTMPDQNFKYTVGIYEGDNGKLRLYIDMDKVGEDGSKESDYYDLDVELYISLTASDIDGDRIIVYGALNGGNSITFSYGTPYNK